MKQFGLPLSVGCPGARIMESHGRPPTIVFTARQSPDDGYWTNRAWPLSANVQSHLASSFADDGHASWYSGLSSADGWTVKTVVTWRSSASMIPAPVFETSTKECVSVWCQFQRDAHLYFKLGLTITRNKNVERSVRHSADCSGDHQKWMKWCSWRWRWYGVHCWNAVC